MTDRVGQATEAPDESMLLLEGELLLRGRIMPASNATFFGELLLDGVEAPCVYKPVAGERPLWDFPEGTLAGRERAAYLVSEALGWDVVPPTVLRDGRHGPGMVQLWREPDPDQDPVDIVATETLPEGYLHVLDAMGPGDEPVALVHENSDALRRMAVFDIVINNADRKGGHVLAMPDGHRYGVDHGVAFHVENKLRTVLWGWAGSPLTHLETAAVRRLAQEVTDGEIAAALAPLVTRQEITALVDRCLRLLAAARMPSPARRGPAIPWPAF